MAPGVKYSIGFYMTSKRRSSGELNFLPVVWLCPDCKALKSLFLCWISLRALIKLKLSIILKLEDLQHGHLWSGSLKDSVPILNLRNYTLSYMNCKCFNRSMLKHRLNYLKVPPQLTTVFLEWDSWTTSLVNLFCSSHMWH